MICGGLNMIWRLAKDHDLSNFWPYGRLKGPKIENETSKTIVLLSFCPWTKITGRHEQVYIVVLPDWKLYNQSHIDTDRVYYCRKFSNRCALLYWLWLNCGTKIFYCKKTNIWQHIFIHSLETYVWSK